MTKHLKGQLLTTREAEVKFLAGLYKRARRPSSNRINFQNGGKNEQSTLRERTKDLGIDDHPVEIALSTIRAYNLGGSQDGNGPGDTNDEINIAMNAGLIGIATARFVYFYRQWTSHANEFKATVFHKAGRYKDIRVPKGGAIIEDKVYGAMQAISEVIVSDYRVIVLESRHQQNWSTVMNYVCQTAQQNGFSPFNNNNEVAWAMFSQKVSPREVVAKCNACISARVRRGDRDAFTPVRKALCVTIRFHIMQSFVMNSLGNLTAESVDLLKWVIDVICIARETLVVTPGMQRDSNEFFGSVGNSLRITFESKVRKYLAEVMTKGIMQQDFAIKGAFNVSEIKAQLEHFIDEVRLPTGQNRRDQIGSILSCIGAAYAGHGEKMIGAILRTRMPPDDINSTVIKSLTF